jgi:glycerol kinase
LGYILALDQGTSSSRAIVYRDDGSVAALAQYEIAMSFPDDGWVEQDPEELWRTTLQAGRDAIAQAGADPEEIHCIGITNQRETSLVWDRATGACPNAAIVWQDRRTADRCAAMADDEVDGMPLPEYFAERTGLVIDPYFSATKLAWLLDEVEGVRARAEAGEICFGTVDTFLIWRLTKGTSHVTEASNASRTQLYDIHDLGWDDAILDYFDIPESVLPTVLDSVAHFGTADAEWFGAPIPILGVAGDQQAALIGQGCFKPGMSKSTYGTGCFIMTNTGGQALKSSQQLLTTIAYQLRGETTYALEGSIFVAGVAVKWLRDQLGLIADVRETQEAYRRTGGDAGGVVVVPAFTGLGAPHWEPDARGTITGITLDTGRDEIVTAILQSIVLQTADLMDAMAADGAAVETIRVDGGMVVNDAFCQALADILNVPVERPEDIETTARGAAVLAAIGEGLLEDLATASVMWRLDQAFVPVMDDERRQMLRDGFTDAVRRVIEAAR